MNLNKRLIASGISSLLIILTMTGCGKRPAPQQVSNKHINGSMLAVRYIGDGEFKNVYNRPVLGFSLNDYSPLSFKTDVYRLNKNAIWGSNAPKPVANNKYSYVECDSTVFEVTTVNVIVGIVTLGILPLTGGGCHNRSVFDYEEFDEDVKAWIDKHDIDREVLISKYSELLQYAKDKSQSAHPVYEDANNIYNKEYSEAYETYQDNSPILVNKYIDESGLYKQETLPEDVKVSLNEVTQHILNDNIGFDKTYVDEAFPCSGMEKCLANMDTAKEKIDKKSLLGLDEAKMKASEWLKTSKEELVKDTSSYSIEFSDEPLYVTFGNKTIKYEEKAQTLVKAGKKAKKVKVTYTVKSLSYRDVFPSYNNNNKDIAVSFNPETKKITLTNMTDGYIQIKSIDLYYNREIAKLGDSRQKNYSLELAPQSESAFDLTHKIADSNFSNITKKVALNTSVSFGFSVKYSLGDSTKNRTLYKTKKQSLYKLISKL